MYRGQPFTLGVRSTEPRTALTHRNCQVRILEDFERESGCPVSSLEHYGSILPSLQVRNRLVLQLPVSRLNKRLVVFVAIEPNRLAAFDEHPHRDEIYRTWSDLR